MVLLTPRSDDAGEGAPRRRHQVCQDTCASPRLLAALDVYDSVGHPVPEVASTHPDRVFTYDGELVTNVHDTAYPRTRAGRNQVRAHDRKTYVRSA
jgi:hypothetical protein